MTIADGVIVTDVRRCARCGHDHEGLAFRLLTRSIEGDPPLTHWCLCPDSNEPLLLAVVEPAAPSQRETEVTCRGDARLGTACGKCKRCIENGSSSQRETGAVDAEAVVWQEGDRLVFRCPGCDGEVRTLVVRCGECGWYDKRASLRTPAREPDAEWVRLCEKLESATLECGEFFGRYGEDHRDLTAARDEARNALHAHVLSRTPAAEPSEAEVLLEAIRTRCKVVYFPPQVGGYPIEHNLYPGKDAWAFLRHALLPQNNPPAAVQPASTQTTNEEADDVDA